MQLRILDTQNQVTCLVTMVPIMLRVCKICCRQASFHVPLISFLSLSTSGNEIKHDSKKKKKVETYFSSIVVE